MCSPSAFVFIFLPLFPFDWKKFSVRSSWNPLRMFVFFIHLVRGLFAPFRKWKKNFWRREGESLRYWLASVLHANKGFEVKCLLLLLLIFAIHLKERCPWPTSAQFLPREFMFAWASINTRPPQKLAGSWDYLWHLNTPLNILLQFGVIRLLFLSLCIKDLFNIMIYRLKCLVNKRTYWRNRSIWCLNCLLFKAFHVSMFFFSKKH